MHQWPAVPGAGHTGELCLQIGRPLDPDQKVSTRYVTSSENACRLASSLSACSCSSLLVALRYVLCLLYWHLYHLQEVFCHLKFGHIHEVCYLGLLS